MMKHGRSARIPKRRLPHATALAGVIALALFLLVAAPALARPLVVVDAGHGGPYNNARYGTFLEKQANLLFALELGVQLYAAGYDVNFTRTTDTAVTYADIPTWHWISAEGRWLYAADGLATYADGVPRDDLQARCNVANDHGADVFISIHCNGSSSTAANGTENWAATNDAYGFQLGQYVQNAVLEQTRQRDRGAGQMNFYVVRWANMPALLIETGFMSNPTEGKNLANPAWRQAYVRGIVNGLNRWMATNPIRPAYARYAGATRSDTAVLFSRDKWATGASTVLLASTGDTTSALAAPLATAKLGAPLLFADVHGMSATTAAEIARLRPAKILAFGSDIPDATLEQAAAAAGLDPSAVERIAGTEPLATAPLLSERLLSVDTSVTVVLASGGSASDALAAATLAASRGASLLLAHPNGSLPAEAAEFLARNTGNIRTVITVGAVPDGALVGLPNRSRIGASEPYQTFSAVIAAARPSGSVWLYPYNPAVAVDSLTAVSVAAYRPDGVPLPIRGKYLSPYTREWLENSGHRIGAVTMVGDQNSLPPLADLFVIKATR